MHYSLAYPENRIPTVIWDLFLNPKDTIKPINNTYPFDRNAAAVTPYSADMRIFSKDMPWMIIVKGKGGHAITVGDAFQAIYDQLQQPITYSEWRLMPDKRKKETTERYFERVNFFREMYANRPDEAKKEAEAGIKRVDYLGSKYAFIGLRRDDKTVSELQIGQTDLNKAWVLLLGERPSS